MLKLVYQVSRFGSSLVLQPTKHPCSYPAGCRAPCTLLQHRRWNQCLGMASVPTIRRTLWLQSLLLSGKKKWVARIMRPSNETWVRSMYTICRECQTCRSSSSRRPPHNCGAGRAADTRGGGRDRESMHSNPHPNPNPDPKPKPSPNSDPDPDLDPDLDPDPDPDSGG